MNESMEENSLHAILDEDGFGGHYGTADDNDHGYFQHSIDMSGQTSFTGTGGGEEIRLVLPSSPHMNSNRPGTNLVPMSLAPSGTSPHSQAPYPGFLFPPSQQMPAGRNPGSVGSSPAHSGASSPLLSASSRFKEKKKRRRLTSEETRILVEVFDRTQKPNGPLRKELAGRLDMTSRAIQIWFQNRRAKVKRDTAGGESESGIEMSPPPEETGLLKSEYSSAAVSAVGTPLGSAPGSSHSTPNHTPPASVHGTPNNKRSQKFSLAHSVADSLLAKNAKARSQNVQQTGSAVRVALPGSPQPPGGIGAGKNVPLAPRPMGPIPIVPGQNYGQAPQGTFPSQQPYYVHQPAPPIQPQHQHVLLQLHQQHKQQLHLQQFQQQQSDDKNRNNDHNSFLQQQQNSHDRPGNQFLMSPTRNVGVDPSRLSRIDAPGEDRMDLDVYPMMTDETMTLSYDEYSTRVAHQERLSPFLFESNPTYLPSVDPELASPTTAQFLSSFLTSAERSVLADTEPPATGANPDTDLFDPFQMFTRESGDDINLLLMQDAANSPSGRRRYSIGVNSTYEPVSRQDASLEYFPRRSRSLADIFDGVPNPLSQRTASRPLPPSDEYWNDGFQRPEESLFDSILSEPSGAPTSSAFDMDTSDMFKSAEIAPPAPVFDSSLGRNSTDFASSVAEPHRGLPVHVRKKLGMPNSPSRLASSLPLEAYTIPSTSTPPTLLGAVPSPRAKRMRSIDDNIDLLTQLNLGLTLPPQGHGGSTYQGQPKEKRGFAM